MGYQFQGGLKTTEMWSKGSHLCGGGRYVLEIENTLMKDSQQTKGIHFYIVELRVLSASPTSEATEAQAAEIAKMKPGEKKTWMVKMEDQNALSNIKGFLLPVLGIAKTDTQAIVDIADSLDGVFLQSWYEDGRPKDASGKTAPSDLVGLKVECTTRMTKTRAQKDFTVHNFAPHVAPAA